MVTWEFLLHSMPWLPGSYTAYTDKRLKKVTSGGTIFYSNKPLKFLLPILKIKINNFFQIQK